MPIFWAVILAIVFYPIQAHFVRMVQYKTIAALLTLLCVFAIIFVPLWVLGGQVVEQSLDLYERVSTEDSGVTRAGIMERVTDVLGFLERYGIEQNEVRSRLSSFAQTGADFVTRQAVVFGQATFGFLVSFLLTVYLLFFLLRDGPAIGTKIMHIIPLGKEREWTLYQNFVAVTRSIFKGTLVVSVVQGTIGGILFVVAGIDGALLWGVIMALLSIIPALGSFIVWFPAGLLLLLTGSVWQGVVVLGGGIFVISLIDNVLRPILVRRDVQMPDAIILISILGGLSVFGITGFIIGPIIAGFFFSMWSIFEQDYTRELESRG